MQYYRCKCGRSEARGSMPPNPCDRCRFCGSDLATGPDLHRDPRPHRMDTQVVVTDAGEAMTREDGGRLYDADHLATQITEARAALAAVPPPVPAVSANPYASLYYPLLFLVTVAERFPRSLGEWLDREPEPPPLSAAMMKRLRDSRELHRALERRGMDPAEVLPALAAAEAERDAAREALEDIRALAALMQDGWAIRERADAALARLGEAR